MSTIKNIRGGIAFIRDIGRLRQIVAVLWRHGFGEVLERLNLGSGVVGKVAGVRDEGGERVPLERRALHAIEELGPTFVKLGQILSTRPDLIPPEFVAEFQTLQDKVSPIPAEVVRAKGLVHLASHPGTRAVMHVVGRRAELCLDEPWGERAPATGLVLIGWGDPLPPQQLEQMFRACEVEPGQGGPGSAVMRWVRRVLPTREAG